MNSDSAPILAYSELPIGSRLIVSRESDALIIVDPPTGLWNRVKGTLLLYAIYVCIAAAGVYWLMHRIAPGFPQVWQDGWKSFVQGMLLPDNEFVVIIVAWLIIMSFIGRTSTSIRVHGDTLDVDWDGTLWPGRHWSRHRTYGRDHMISIRAARFSARVLFRYDGKKKAIQLSGNRRDALWLARTLRHEFGFSEDVSAQRGQ